jgi:hypothetical protein
VARVGEVTGVNAGVSAVGGAVAGVSAVATVAVTVGRISVGPAVAVAEAGEVGDGTGSVGPEVAVGARVGIVVGVAVPTGGV